MQIRILTSDDELNRKDRQAIERRVRLVVGRHAAGVARLQLRLRRSENDEGEVSYRCRAVVDLGRGRATTFVAEDVDPLAAAVRAAWRIQRRLRHRPMRPRRRPAPPPSARGEEPGR